MATHLRLLIFLFFIICPSMSIALLNGTELLKEVCNHTSNYTFCVATLNADPNASGPHALAGDLANAALRLAQTKAKNAQSLIAGLLLRNATSADTTYSEDRNRLLQLCQSSNDKAMSALSSANNEFNSDSVDTMVAEMNRAAYATKDCQNQIQGGISANFSQLTTVNGGLIKLCEICIVSTTYFTVEDFY